VLHKALSAAVNIGRSLPFIILMVAITPLTRMIAGSAIGVTAAMVPLTIGAIPFVARLFENALQEVDRGAIEAAQIMGATPWQIVRKVYLPEALPAMIRALTVATVTLIGYSAMAGAVGGGGLGDLAIRCGYQGFRLDVMIATVALMIALIQILQWGGDHLALRIQRGRPIVALRPGKALVRWSAAFAVLLLVVGVYCVHSELHRPKPLRVGVNPIPHGEILQFLQPELKRQGVDLQIVYFTDYVQPNLALAAGDLDANYFQHCPFLEIFNRNHGTHIVAVANVHIEPLGLYPGRVRSLAALADGAQIGVPNDPVNLGRALMVLQSAGLLKLRAGVSINATQQDIAALPARP
jgi:ABC-type methionine transport system permease subunit